MQSLHTSKMERTPTSPAISSPQRLTTPSAAAPPPEASSAAFASPIRSLATTPSSPSDTVGYGSPVPAPCAARSYAEAMPEWGDDMRMRGLFKTLPMARDQPLSDVEHRRCTWWRGCILGAAAAGSHAVVELDQLHQWFRRKRLLPLCLERILVELVQEGQLVPLDQWPPQQGVGRRVASALWSGVSTPAAWVWSAITSSPGPSAAMHALPPGPYVVAPVVATMVDAFMRAAHDCGAVAGGDSIVPLEQVWDRLAHWNERSRDLVLQHVVRQRRVALLPAELGCIKIGPSPDARAHVELVPEVDVGTARLKRCHATMSRACNHLESRIQALNASIRDRLQAGSRDAAMRVLRKRKLLEEAWAKRSQACDNVERILMSVHDARSTADAMAAYRDGLSTLQRAQSNVSIDDVEAVMSDLADAYDVENDISAAMEAGSRQMEEAVGIDMEALEAELAELTMEDLPNVPQHEPFVQPQQPQQLQQHHHQQQQPEQLQQQQPEQHQQQRTQEHQYAQ